jgi:hypothetical protein
MGRYDFNGEPIIVMQYKEWFDDINIPIKKIDDNEKLEVLKDLKINKFNLDLLEK